MNILAYATSHNTSAALMTKGRIVGLIQEERFTKRKNQTGYPKKAVDALVRQHLGGDVSRLDQVIVAGHNYSPMWVDCPLWFALDHYSRFGVMDWVREMHEYWYPYFYGDRESVRNYFREALAEKRMMNEDHNFDFSFLETMTPNEGNKYFCSVERPGVAKRHLGWDGSVPSVEHHECHAYYALYGGGMQEDWRRNALVLTADSWGDNINWSVGIGTSDGRIERLACGDHNLISRIYKFVTLILGMKPNEHEYKVMGLSGYSKSSQHIEAVERIFFEVLDFRDGCFVSEKPLKDSYFDLGKRLEGHRFDNIAAGLQNWATQVTLSWIHHWVEKTERRDVCLSGGLFMNIKMNGEILKMPEVKSLSVPASGGDESISAGACYAWAARNGGNCLPMTHVYLGEPAEAAQSWLDRLSETPLEPNDFAVMECVTAESIAKLLAADCILARCVGNAEFGARALGNRSILANPANPENIKTINDSIKNRDFWMPFTPSILAEYADAYLDNPKSCVSPFMTIGFASLEEKRREIIGGLHPGDFSARPQFVIKETNPEYWRLIDEFRKITGIPAVMNTSLNLHGEPMNYDLADAARTLTLSQLDYLIMPGDRLLYKRSAEDTLMNIIERRLVARHCSSEDVGIERLT